MEPEEFFKMSDPMDHAPFRLVNVDSEFINCHTLEEICIAGNLREGSKDRESTGTLPGPSG